ncbi:MAG: DEAD/DEAH box helicase, partial [Planctomycetes bacterium]|nr:DEAD/DEAH box helicase [Planctomycetota bacterium]
MRYKGFELYPFQEQAIRAVEAGQSVLVSAPTGAGKTVIAEFAIDRALELKERIVYTSPVKALTNQKYRDFHDEYGDEIG